MKSSGLVKQKNYKKGHGEQEEDKQMKKVKDEMVKR